MGMQFTTEIVLLKNRLICVASQPVMDLLYHGIAQVVKIYFYFRGQA